jgi:hypothetical protein
MERQDRAAGFDHSCLEGTACAVVLVIRCLMGRPGLHPVEEPAEGRGLRDVKVVTGEQPHPGAPTQCREYSFM